MKQCNTCKELKDTTAFSKDSRNNDKLNYKCRSCRKIDKDIYEQSGQRKATRYGLDVSVMKEMLAQGCTICKSNESLTIDHDHDCCPGRNSCGKCVRGVLCHTCNVGVGMFKNNTFLLHRAIEYLQNR